MRHKHFRLRVKALLMAAVMAVWNRKRMENVQIAAVVLALSGTYLIATKGSLTSIRLSAAGLIFGILSAVGVVTYTLLSRPIIGTWGNITVTGWGMLVGGTVLFALTKAWNLPQNLDGMAWLMIAVIVLVGTAIGFSVFLESVRYIGPIMRSKMPEALCASQQLRAFFSKIYASGASGSLSR